MNVRELRTRYFSNSGRLARAQQERGSVVRVVRQEIPYWVERGWRREGNTYFGAYQTPFGAFIGRVEDRGWGDLRFYIIGPPDELRHSGHWACFQPRGEKGFLVHMSTRPKDIGSGILTIEHLIIEAFGNA